MIEAALTEAAEASVKAAALFGRAWEPADLGRKPKAQRLGAIAREAGMAVVRQQLHGLREHRGRPARVRQSAAGHVDPPGGVALISHSGTAWSGLVGNQRQLRFNYAISAGQEIATTAADYIRFMLAQPETRVIACILETVRDPGRVRRGDRSSSSAKAFPSWC